MRGDWIKSVSVITNPDGSLQSLITWTLPTLPPNAVGYIINEYVGPAGGCNVPLDTLLDPTATSYTYNGFKPNGYSVAVYDGTQTVGDLPQPHAPAHLTEAVYDTCNYTLQFSWTPYIGWNAEDILYNVYAIVNGQSQWLAAVESATSFVWTEAPDGVDIDLYVRATNKRDASVVSDSPYWHITPINSKRPAHLELSQLVQTQSQVTLSFDIDPATELRHFEIQRAAAGAAFDTRHVFADKTLTTYTDEADEIYQYRVAAVNVCGIIARVSDTLQNFFSQMTLRDNTWHLQWNEPLQPNDYTFSLQRLKPAPAVLVTGISGYTFSDPVIAMHNQPSLEFCYRLEAAVPRGLSVSETCAFYVPRITMPDAIDPLNHTVNTQTGRARSQFGPVVNAHSATYKYRLSIINRNGAKIADVVKDFADNPIEKSWNGCFNNGNAVPEEVYTYFLEIEFEGGRNESLSGPVTVMYP